MSDKFLDKDGQTHIVEFEEVIAYTPVPDNDKKVEVVRKAFPRKLDGFEWRSEELARENLPIHVYSSMWNCIMTCKGRRTKIDRVSMSCHIACVDTIHQGQFNTLASHSSPFVFNNACWSWAEIAAFFLECGVRGYIGTLWAIENQAAVTAAKVFYEHVFSRTVLVAFHETIKALRETESRDIYIYWGLHFTKLVTGTDCGESKKRVRRELMRSAVSWTEKILHGKDPEVKRNSIKVLARVFKEIQQNFAGEDWNELEKELRTSISTNSRSASPKPAVQSSTTKTCLDFPREYQSPKERN